MKAPTAISTPSLPDRESEMAGHIRAFDWAATSLGVLVEWPQSLKTAVAIGLDSAFATFVFWGPELVQIYNDAAIKILQAKHPHTLGLPAAEVWREVWDTIDPLFEGVLSTGQPFTAEALPVTLERGGSLEPAWFTFCYSALRDESGQIAGLQAVAIETTSEVEADAAREESERRLAARLSDANQLQQISTALIEEQNPAALYNRILDAARTVMRSDAASMQVLIPDTNTLSLLAWTGFHPESAHFWESVTAASDTTCGRALLSGERVVIPDIATDAGLAGTEDLAAYQRSALRAVQSTPLVSRTGQVLGMISTHWTEAHEPSEREFAMFDVLGRQAADLIERAQTESLLRENVGRHAFLLTLSDVLRPLADPTEIQDTASRLLGEHLGVDRVGYGAGDEDTVVVRDWTSPGMPSVAGEYQKDEFGKFFTTPLLENRPSVIEDALHDPRVSREAYASSWELVGVRSTIAYPLLKRGLLVAALFIHQRSPRSWSDGEVSLVVEVGERTWAALERARAEAALRKSEDEYRTLFQSIDQGFCTVEVLFAEQNRPVDYIFLEINPAFDRSTGLGDAVGQRAREIIPGHEEFWFETYGRIAQSGEPERFEHEAAALGRWYDVFAYRVGEPEQHRVAILFEDITDRRRADDALRESEDRFRGVANLVPDLVWVNDPEGHFTWVNQRWTSFTGQAPEAAAGHGWYEAVHPDERDETYAAYQRAVVAGEPFERAVRILDKDGTPRWFLIRSVPTWDSSGNVSQRYGTATDIHAERDVRDELTARVAVATSELRLLSRRLLEVQEDERRYLARELHDEIGQALTGLQLQIAAAQRSRGNGSLAALQEAEQLVRELTSRVSELSVDLRPAALDSLGLLPAILLLVGRVQERFGITVDLRHQGLNGRFTPAVEIAAYRIVQEALTNVARHASTDAALVQLLAGAETMTVSVQDNGAGFEPSAQDRSGGLSGMRERVELLNGVFAIGSAPGAGTTVTADFPLPGPGKSRSGS